MHEASVTRMHMRGLAYYDTVSPHPAANEDERSREQNIFIT